MSLFGGLSISASGLTAERVRMDVIAENLANAESTRGADGQPYKRKLVVLGAAAGGGSSFADTPTSRSTSAAISAIEGSADDSSPKKLRTDARKLIPAMPTPIEWTARFEKYLMPNSAVTRTFLCVWLNMVPVTATSKAASYLALCGYVACT